jgi:hypothetical protein
VLYASSKEGHFEGVREERCRVMLVMIGRQWTKLADDDGRRRLDDTLDHVRVEIATALKLGVSVVPLLVQDASMPKAKDLPDDIRDLAFQNGMSMPRAFWKEPVDKLLGQLTRVVEPEG